MPCAAFFWVKIVIGSNEAMHTGGCPGGCFPGRNFEIVEAGRVPLQVPETLAGGARAVRQRLPEAHREHACHGQLRAVRVAALLQRAEPQRARA
jgi:hypothetical protein